jgi:hypothetical protein
MDFNETWYEEYASRDHFTFMLSNLLPSNVSTLTQWGLSGHQGIALMMEAVNTYETSANFYQITWRNAPGDSHLHIRRRENLKSHTDHSPTTDPSFCINSVWSSSPLTRNSRTSAVVAAALNNLSTMYVGPLTLVQGPVFASLHVQS